VTTLVRHFRVMFRHSLQFYLRSKRFLGLLGITLALVGVFLGLQFSGVDPVAPTAAQYAQGSLGNADFLLLLIAAFLGGDATAPDQSDRTELLLLTQPVRREVVIGARFFAITATGGLLSGVYYLGTIVGALGSLAWCPRWSEPPSYCLSSSSPRWLLSPSSWARSSGTGALP